MSKNIRSLSTIAFIISASFFAAIAGLYFYNIILWSDYPDLGFSYRTATGLKVVGVVRQHGLDAGLQVGDKILELNGQTYSTIEELRAILKWNLGENNIWLIERDNRVLQIPITNVPSGFKRSFSVSGFPSLLGLCYILIGTLVFLMKPHRRSSWVFFLSTTFFGLFAIFINPLGQFSPPWLENFTIVAYCFTPAVITHLALSFPQERNLLLKYPAIQFAPYLISIILFVLIRQDARVMYFAPTHWLIIAVSYMAFSLFFFLGSCLQLRLRSKSQIVKLRARMVLLGFAIAASLPLSDLIINAFFNVYLLPNFNYYLPFLLFVPAFIGYSIVKHDLFDIDAIIKRTYGYVLTTGAIAGIYGLFVLISNLAFGSYEFSKSPAFPLIFLLAIVFLFNPIRDRVQRIIDRVFYRLEYNYQETVQHISESMRTLLSLDEIGKNIMATALGTMFIDSGSVMLRKKDTNEYRCFIQAGETDKAIRNAGTDPYVSTGEDRQETEEPAKATSEKKAEQVPPELALPADEPFIRKVAELKKEVIIDDIQEDPFFEDQRESCENVFAQLDATLIVPLIYEDRLTGLISLGRKRSGKFYRREDINLLNILANQGAVAIENAQMVEEVVEKERMEEELNIARDLQVSMLPAETPQIKGFEIAAFSDSAREVGGDFYDFIDMGADKAGMLIGDVTGKSVSGALVMSSSRSIFRMLSEEALTVAESMIRANRRLKKDVTTGMFVALLYAVFDSRDKTLTLCSAGQTQPVHVSAQTGEAVLVETKGDTFPLGILEDAAYEDTQLSLVPGDKVILYTDGIVEAMNADKEIFGFDRLLEIAKDSQAMTAGALLDEVKIKVTEFAGSAPQHDDITVIVVSVLEE